MFRKIIVKNTCIIINDYTFGDCQKLENYFRIFDPVTHSCFYIGLYYDEENKRLYLPRGLDIFFIEKLLNEEAYVEKNSYIKYDKYDDIMIKYLPRDEVQKETLRFMLGEGEYSATKTKSQLQVNLNTGKGKTYVAIASMAYLGIKTIVITYSNSWLTQWKERTIEYCNIKRKEIFYISGSGCIYRLLNKSPEEISKYKLFLVTHSTLKSYGDNNGWDSITHLFEYIKVGIKIYDEAHLNFENMCKIDFFTNIYKTYYLTATAVRSSEDENRIYQLSFKNVLAIDLFNEEEDPHTDYIGIKYNSQPTPMQISSCKNQYGLDRNKYTNFIVTNDNFYKLLTILMEIIQENVGYYEKCLLYIGTNDAILKVFNWIVENYPQFHNNIGIYTSIVDAKIKEEALSKRLILSTTKSAGAAVDIKNLKMTVVLAEPFKSEVIARQTLGRTRQDNTMYIEIVDTGFYHINKYFVHKKPIFNKYAKDCSEIIIDNRELENRYDKIIDKRNSLEPPVKYCNELISPVIYEDNGI